MEWRRSEELLERARESIAGGVNSNVRLGGLPRPLFFARGEGPRLTDVDGNIYIDFVLGQGPLIHGHGHPELLRAAAQGMQQGMMFAAQHEGEIRLAERIRDLVPCAQRVRVSSAGSEAVQAALRLARAHTGRPKIVKFEGHYHGWFDNVLVSVAPPPDQAGPAEEPRAVPGSRGQSEGAYGDLIVLPWNDPELLEHTLRSRVGEIAGVITEPVMCNVGCVLPQPGYLETMRRLCDELGMVLIFDEVITGFRLAPGGAQELLGVTPDLATFAKAMAGGFPISCLAGRRELMDLLTQGVNHSGTYNANLLAVAAAEASLDLLNREDGAAYRHLFRLGERLREGVRDILAGAGVSAQVQGIGPVFHVALAPPGETLARIVDYRTAARADTPRYHRLAVALLERRVRVLERGLWYVSTSHTDREIDETLAAFRDAVGILD